MTVVRLAMVTVFGLGCLRPGPGTWGSAATVVLVLGVLAAGIRSKVVNTVLVATIVFFSLACLVGGRWAEEFFGAKDPSQVAADETDGQAVALLALPWAVPGEPGGWTANLVLTAIAFGAFRLFDIVKPPPIRQVQRVGGGTGILLDDLMAGAAALAVTHVVAWLAF